MIMHRLSDVGEMIRSVPDLVKGVEELLSLDYSFGFRDHARHGVALLVAEVGSGETLWRKVGCLFASDHH